MEVGKEARENEEWRWVRRPERKESGDEVGNQRERRVEVGKETREKGEWRCREGDQRDRRVEVGKEAREKD